MSSREIILLLLIGVLCILFVSWFLRNNQITTTSSIHQLLQYPDRSTVYLLVGQKELSVEVVHSAESITQGLSGRSSIGTDGMLFVFKQKQLVSFWMKGMLFDLDMVWIADGKVVGVTTHIPKPAPELTLDELPRYPSPEQVDAVLELPAGSVDQYGFTRDAIIQWTE